MELSEKELLLLSCFMYTDIAPRCEKGTYVSDIIAQFTDSSGEISVDLINKSNIKFSGDCNAEVLADVLNQMQQSYAIKNLRIMATTEEYTGSIRAACFVDCYTGKATVAFRGTGGSYRQWNNNFEGYGDLSQQSQRDAVAFIESLPYDDIDTTGHSNGGDQAMFATIVCGDKISRCVSFEGQGVSKEFANEYMSEIEENKIKIKNICGEKDFVSPILIDIAGETVYVRSESKLLGGVFSHGAYGILVANKTALDKNNGYFPNSFIEQAWYCKVINQVTTMLADKSDSPIAGSITELCADVVGIVVGLTISKSWNDLETLSIACDDLKISLKDFMINIADECIDAINNIYNSVRSWLFQNDNHGSNYLLVDPQIILDTYKLNSYAQRLHTVNMKISELDNQLNVLYWKVGLFDLFDLIQADFLVRYSNGLLMCANYLSDTSNEFMRIENELTGYL